MNAQNSKKADQYYSVEFFIDEVGIAYQFKIWKIDSTSMFILINANSHILPLLKVGDKLNTKCYSTDLVYPLENLATEIRSITRQDQGRFKGHCLVGFEILDNQGLSKVH